MTGPWRPFSHLNMFIRPPNPSYFITYYKGDCDDYGNGFCLDQNVFCPTTGYLCDDGSGSNIVDNASSCDQYDNDPTWTYPIVAGVTGTNYTQNSGSPYFNQALAEANVCYPTDSNSVDHRYDQYGKLPGELPNTGDGGCHDHQDYLCDRKDKRCLSYWDSQCQCDYDTHPGDTVGAWVSNNSDRADAWDLCGKKQLQPGAWYPDYMACWYDASNSEAMEHLVAHASSLWTERTGWLNDNLPSNAAAGGFDDGELVYHGWTECTVKVDDEQQAADALVIIIPALPYPGDYEWSLCDLDKEYALPRLDENLHAMYNQGWGTKPVVIMEQYKGGLTQDECDKYWGGTNCDDGYRKGLFKQNFLFPSGTSCLLINDDGNVYYYRDWENSNDPSLTPCQDAWGLASTGNEAVSFA
eukprot:CAMPEP_0183724404 /NCGR_PEP_ID=MMETSP0737-20130205/17908_1 /TAXON_ID=385413 /ORGANISM="Thalassiosira miniscula, Strain CCMP1093" /LENGTH=410 /DNA_ID=CAMNT_0025954983 /DNA_START=430 /DNA_END=1662 /DNA_ORIENTATION=+